MERRYFLLGSAVALGACRTRLSHSPSETVRVACIGLGAQGRQHLNAYSQLPNVEIAAICDIDDAQISRALALLADLDVPKPQVYKDFRKILDDKSIQALSIASPNHWHTLMTIWGCQAGKDIYVEKPCSHNIFEARQIVAAARKYDRMVQQGTQIRSSVAVREAVQNLREGLIGDVYLARGLCFKWRNSIGRMPVEPAPAGVDYDLWNGPAPAHAFTRNRFHYNWHWFWDLGNGDIGNQGLHQMDVARWGLGVQYPTKVSAMGGHFLFDDDQETPNTLSCMFEFNASGKKQILEFAVRHWMTDGECVIGDSDHNAIGNLFFGSRGYLAVDSYTSYKTRLGKDQTAGPAKSEGGDHFLNFIEAVRSRKREKLNAEIQEGAASTVLSHLANISYRVGRTICFDSNTMTCIGDEEANRLVTREYRKPFVVPEVV